MIRNFAVRCIDSLASSRRTRNVGPGVLGEGRSGGEESPSFRIEEYGSLEVRQRGKTQREREVGRGETFETRSFGLVIGIVHTTTIGELPF